MSLGSRLAGQSSQASAPPPAAHAATLAVGACVLAPYHGEYYEAIVEALLTQQRAIVKFDGYGNSEELPRAGCASRRRCPTAGRSSTTALGLPLLHETSTGATRWGGQAAAAAGPPPPRSRSRRGPPARPQRRAALHSRDQQPAVGQRRPDRSLLGAPETAARRPRPFAALGGCGGGRARAGGRRVGLDVLRRGRRQPGPRRRGRSAAPVGWARQQGRAQLAAACGATDQGRPLACRAAAAGGGGGARPAPRERAAARRRRRARSAAAPARARSLNREMSDQEIAMLFGGMGCGPGCAC